MCLNYGMLRKCDNALLFTAYHLVGISRHERQFHIFFICISNLWTGKFVISVGCAFEIIIHPLINSLKSLQPRNGISKFQLQAVDFVNNDYIYQFYAWTGNDLPMCPINISVEINFIYLPCVRFWDYLFPFP